MNRPPSSASSLGGRSDGRMGFGGPPGVRDSGRSHFKPDSEDILQRHYYVLRGYLASSLRDEKGNIRPNKARDKLLRLSVTQFMELSTDVYDELIRREDQRTGRVPNVPPSLPPKRDFHPKRNQARQKLSTLPAERFRQLATDVFFELERRIPRFAGGDIDRPMSGASSRSMRPPPGYRGPPGPGGRPPMGPNGMGPPNAPYQSFRPNSPGPNGPPGMRPLPKTSQSNTMVPNKSTMVEEDDDEDEFGLDKGLSGTGSERFSKPMGTQDQEKLQAQEIEISELKEKTEIQEQEMERLRSSLQEKEEQLERAKASNEQDLNTLREELEQRRLEAERLNENLQRELDMLHQSKGDDVEELRIQHNHELEELRTQLGSSHRQTIGDLRAQLDNVHDQTSDLHRQLQSHQAENEQLRQQLQSAQQLQQAATNEEHERRIEQLQEELANQEELTNKVRDETMMYLQEMRDLSRQNDQAVEQEEKLAARVSQMEREIENWRRRYANVKAQNKNLRASTLGLGLQTSFDSGSLVRQEGLISEGGLVRDTDVTRFQTAVDELLKVARMTDTQPMLDSVKNVVLCVQSITSAVGTDGYPTPSPSPLSPDAQRQQPESVSKLKARVTGTANSLITATKQHATASGLSPVALLDAAASNLTASVVELIKAVGICPSSPHELHSDVETSEYGDDINSFYDDRMSPHDDEEVPSIAVSGHAKTPSVQVSAGDQSKPAPLNLGRSNTTKKINGWFGGWGRKASTGEDEATLPANEYPADEYD